MENPEKLGFKHALKIIRDAKEKKFDSERFWNAGDLSYKFWPVQKEMAKVLDSKGSLKKVLNCSRRIRKTTTALIKSCELCLKKEYAQVRFVAPTQKMLRKIIHPIMRVICDDAPKNLKPIWKSQDGVYYFPSSKSELHVAGCNNGHEDDSLGTAADLCVVDEAEAVDNLRYMVDDVLMPQLITGNGQLWMLLTPPKTPIHESVEYVLEAKQKNDNSYAEFDIYKSGYTHDVISKFCEEAGGKDSTTWLRQYMCQFVVDKNFIIVPEFSDKKHIGTYVADEFNKFYARYLGMDIGVRDLTVVLFAIYDFKKSKLFIQDELIISGPDMTTEKLAKEIREKEFSLWQEKKPQLRIADNNNLILLQDLSLLHQMHFAPTSKDTLEAMVNQMRLWVSAGKIVVDSRCEQTIGCLKYGVWDDKRTGWERSKVYGHFDALAALMYLIRNVDVSTNPIPSNYGLDSDRMFINENKNISENAKTLEKAFLRRK